MFRSNMRQFFILSLFLIRSKNVLKSSREHFFGDKLAAFLKNNLLIRVLKPIALIFNYRIYQITRYILKQAFTINFFLITNDEINATFLSRYIAKKLDYHHKLKSVLNPLKREFKQVGFNTAVESTSKEGFLMKSHWLKQVKIFWRLFLIMLFSYYELSLNLFYNIENTWFSIDWFILFKWIAYISKLSYNFDNDRIKIYRLVVKRRSAFVCFFMQDINSLAPAFYKAFFSLRLTGLNIFNNWSDVLHFIILDLYTNKFSIISSLIKMGSASQFSVIKMGIFQFRRFLKFNYNSFSYAAFVNNTTANI